ncbi:MAG: DUF475 domain-containing protein [Candidatus Nealsonbacteria bacterium DGGOD1a]|jgi:Uncharacterized protein conserved in bacteria|nr:MAG: DUF475 domain-containing protein [Candidatus Nealsonbacteria bacterium DGGOD1a]
MDIINILLVVGGLAIFEIVNSIDNAIINAHVLKTMSVKWRKIFLFWGLIFAVFVIRGVLPFLIVWITVPGISIVEAFQAMFSGAPEVVEAINAGKPLILMGAGVFLLLLYLHWLFLEEKLPLFVVDKLIKPHFGIWFFACAAVLLTALLYFAKANPLLMLSAAIGNAMFFILYGFREQAEKGSERLLAGGGGMGDLSKFLYLEVLDASFSFDGVLGAFAFTTSIPLILIGNGVGAFVVREMTIRSIDKVANYKFLKNGAMTSIGILGAIIIFESFSESLKLGFDIPDAAAPLITFALVGVAFWESHKLLKKENHAAAG